MKPLINTINTTDGKFHRRNKHTGELSTIVTADYMNDSQEALRSLQNEVIAVLAEAGYLPSEINSDQLLNAIRDILGKKFDALGTAAKKNVNRDPKKPDKGAVLRVGDLGIGQPLLIPFHVKLDEFLRDAEGVFYMAQDTANHPNSPSWFEGYFFAFIQAGDSSNKLVRLWNPSVGGEAIGVFTSKFDGEKWNPQFSGWKRAYTELHPPTAAEVGAYAKSESDKRFQPVGDYQPKGDYAAADHAYSKGESDERFQPKGDYQPAGSYEPAGRSYSKEESDQRYLSRNTSIPPAFNPAGYATQQWVDGNYPRRNEAVVELRIIKGQSLTKDMNEDGGAYVALDSGAVLLTYSENKSVITLQYGYIQYRVAGTWLTVRWN